MTANTQLLQADKNRQIQALQVLAKQAKLDRSFLPNLKSEILAFLARHFGGQHRYYQLLDMDYGAEASAFAGLYLGIVEQTLARC